MSLILVVIVLGVQELYEYLDATIMVATSPEEAYRKYDDLTNQHIDQLRKLTKAIQDARIARDNEAIKQVSQWNGMGSCSR